MKATTEKYLTVGNSLQVADAPSIVSRSVYYIDKTGGSNFTVGVSAGVIVSVPLARKSLIEQTIEEVSEDYTKRGYTVNKIY